MEEENTGVNESKVRSRQHIMAKDRKDFRKRMKDFIIHKYHQRYLHLDYTEYKLGRMDVHTSSTWWAIFRQWGAIRFDRVYLGYLR